MIGKHSVASTAAQTALGPWEKGVVVCETTGEKRCFRTSSRARSKDGKIGISHPLSIIFLQVQETWLCWYFTVVLPCSWLSVDVFLLPPLVYQYRYIVGENDFVMPVTLLANCCEWKQNGSPLGGSGRALITDLEMSHVKGGVTEVGSRILGL